MSSKALTALDLLEIGSARGAKLRGEPPQLTVVRELGEADLDLILNPPPTGIKAPAIQRLRNSHHHLARLLAEGVKGVEASAITGYTQSRISMFMADPMFRELVEFYRQNKEAQYLDVHQRLADLGISSVEELKQRLEDEPEKFTNRELIEVMEKSLDRSIAPSKAGGGKVPQIQITFVSPEQPQGPIIDIGPEPTEGS